jgi:serine/threonine protein kinase
VFIVHDYFPSIGLHKCRRKNVRFPESRVAFYTAQIALALKFLQDNGLGHIFLSLEDFHINAEGTKDAQCNMFSFCILGYVKLIIPFHNLTDQKNEYLGK